MTSYLVIVNPASGRGRGARRAAALRDGLQGRGRVDIVETRHRGAAVTLAAESVSSVDRIIVVGGDGTLNEVVTGLMASRKPCDALPELGFLPAGTANVAVRAFAFGSDPARVARALPDALARPVDVGIVRHAGGERPFLLWFGAGFDAVIIDTLNAARTGRMGLSGLIWNAPRVLAALRRYPAPRIDVEVKGSEPGAASSLIAANVGHVAFGGAVVEPADPFDGMLDVVILPEGSKLRLARLGLTMLTSSLHRADGVRHVLTSEVRLGSPGAVPFQVDGEPVGRLPADVRIERGAIRLLRT
jgi:diacylglycerol kinase (ATP)